MNENTALTSSGDLDSQLMEAIHLHHRGELHRAKTLYQSLVAKDPGNFGAIHGLGIIALQESDYDKAQQLIKSALRIEPGNIPALNNLATTYLNAGQLESALLAAKNVYELAPNSFEVLLNLGTILHQSGQIREALEPLRKASLLNPHSAISANLLVACLLKLEQARAAEEVLQNALAHHPSDPDSWANLSVAQHALGQAQSALESAQKAISLRPDFANAWAALAAAQFEMGQIDDAIASYRRAVDITPNVATLCAFANALITSGLHTEALICVQQALELDPNNPTARWLFAIGQVKPMLDTRAQVEDTRANFLAHLDDLQTWYDSAKPAEAYRAVGATQPFYLAYQPFNNRDLLRRYGDFCVRWMQSLPLATPKSASTPLRGRKLRIGFASTHMRNHSVWVAVAKGWVENLNKSKFDVHLFHLGLETDTETMNARRHARHFEDRPTDVLGWAEAIQKSELDVLIYPAIGMDPISSQLASLRLAPIQITTWGHPETSGLNTIDYYLSGENLEPENAQGNYTEQLIKLPNLSVMVEPLKPKVYDPGLDRIGLPKNESLILCPGSPFKYSPVHDWVWIEIAKELERRQHGRLVFFSGSRGAMYGILQKRLRHAFEAANLDFDARVQVVPQLDRPRFFGLMQRSALMLDTIGFSGFNTGLQAIECGLPILTYEGDFMRGRLASCFMRRMDIPELVASSEPEFIARAVELSQDAGARKRLTKEIGKRRKLLFADLAPVRALEEFLGSSTHAA